MSGNIQRMHKGVLIVALIGMFPRKLARKGLHHIVKARVGLRNSRRGNILKTARRNFTESCLFVKCPQSESIGNIPVFHFYGFSVFVFLKGHGRHKIVFLGFCDNFAAVLRLGYGKEIKFDAACALGNKL